MNMSNNEAEQHGADILNKGAGLIDKHIQQETNITLLMIYCIFTRFVMKRTINCFT